MRKLILAMTAVALMAMPAFASVQNIKVSGSIDNTFLHRDNFDLGKGDATDDRSQDIFITQTIVGIAADLSDNVSATVGLINERAWNEPDVTDTGSIDESNTTIHLYLAYVTLREMLYSPLTVVVGRQSFRYGNSFIMDSAGTNNVAANDTGLQNVAEDLTKASTLDAFRAILDYNPLTLEFMYSKVDANTLASTADLELNNDDVDLFGANATWEVGDSMKTLVEAYFFGKVNHNSKTTSGSGDVTKNDSIYVPGLRASTNPIEGLNVQAEVAWQRGVKVEDAINSAQDIQRHDAMGIQLIANYQVPVFEEYKPVAQYVYTWVSGDSNYSTITAANSDGYQHQVSSEKYTAWDPFFENQASGKIYNTLYGLSNAHIHGASLQVSPIEDLTMTGTWTGLWTDKDVRCDRTVPGNSKGEPILCSVGAVNQPDGAAITGLAINDNESQVGHEFDLETVYNYTEDVQIGVNLGMLFPGEVYQGINNQVASQAIVHANVNF